MKIAYRDFSKATRLAGFSSGPFQTAADAANDWLRSDEIQVINIETMTTGQLGGGENLDEIGVRVWYREV